MTTPRTLVISLLSVALLNSTSFAVPITVADFSFETPGNSPNGLIPPNGSLGAWQYERTGLLPATLTDVVFGPSALATDGSNVASLTFLVGALAQVSIYQDIGVPFQANSIYTLTFDMDQNSLANLLSNASASIYSDNTAVATYSGNNLLSLLDGTGPLETVTLQFVTDGTIPTGSLGIGFQIGGGLNVEALGSGLIIDNVRLDVSPVPEPGTAFLMAMTGCWLHCFLRRRRV